MRYSKSLNTVLITVSCLAIFLALAPIAKAGPPIPGMVSHWTFDEGGGTTANDLVGGNHGAIHGAIWTAGQVGDYALEFDGSGDYVEADIGTTGVNITYSFWFKSNNIGMEKRIVTRDWNHSGSFSSHHMDGKIGVIFRSPTPGDEVYLSSDPISPDTWYHTVCVSDGTNVVLYVNGELKDIGSQAIQADSRHLWIGARNFDFNGAIDDVMVFDRALSPAEIEQLYQNGLIGCGDVVELEIAGPNEVVDDVLALYTATAYYENGCEKDVTTDAEWLVEPGMVAQIDKNGILTAEAILPEQDIAVYAEYAEGNTVVGGYKDVVLLAGCTEQELITRNIASAVEIKEGVLDEIETALAKEKASADMLQKLRKDRNYENWSPGEIIRARVKIFLGMIKQWRAKRDLAQSIENLNDSLNTLGYAPQPIPGMVSHWTFDEGGGTTANDLVGGNHGAIHGAIWTAGQVGDYALEFDGSGDYVEADIGTTGVNITYSFWFKSNNIGMEKRIVTRDWNHSGSFSSHHMDGKIGVIFRSPTPGDEVYLSSDPISPDTWYHTVCVSDGTNVVLYVNGELKDIGSQAIQADSRHLWIGARNFDFNGAIDDVMVFDRALSPAEIEQLYQNGI